MPWKKSSHDDPQQVPNPGFSRQPPPAANPLFDPSDSPLSPGGRRGAPSPVPADASLQGLNAPSDARRRRVMLRVRRVGWVARREAARSRFGAIDQVRSSSASRLLSGLDRRGLLERSKSKAVRPRFELRGKL